MIAELGLLRPIKDDELRMMLSWRNAPAVRSNMYNRHEITEADHFLWWEKVCSCPDLIYFMYEYQGTPRGIVAFTGVDKESRNTSWAFYASPDAPRGTGSRMEFLAVDYAFDTLELHKIYCEVLATNPSVIHLHQKFGFRIEGVLREQHLFDGEFIDVYRLGLLTLEWQSRREDIRMRLVQRKR